MVFTSSDARRFYGEGRLFVRIKSHLQGAEWPVGSEIPKGLPLRVVTDLLNAGKVMTDERMAALRIKPFASAEASSKPKSPVTVKLPGRKGI